MKKALVITPIIIIFVIFFCIFFHTVKLVKYYSQKEKYITVTGTVSYIKYNDNNSELYIGFSELNTKLDDHCFKIVGKDRGRFPVLTSEDKEPSPVFARILSLAVTEGY